MAGRWFGFTRRRRGDTLGAGGRLGGTYARASFVRIRNTLWCPMGPNKRAQERERAAARAPAEAKRAEAERKAIAEAQKIVAIWNARQAGGRALWFYPTIGAAIAAGLPWLTLSCPGCGQYASVDLRTLDRHPGGAISSLIPSLSCRRCSPNAPFARLEMLTAERP